MPFFCHRSFVTVTLVMLDYLQHSRLHDVKLSETQLFLDWYIFIDLMVDSKSKVLTFSFWDVCIFPYYFLVPLNLGRSLEFFLKQLQTIINTLVLLSHVICYCLLVLFNRYENRLISSLWWHKY